MSALDAIWERFREDPALTWTADQLCGRTGYQRGTVSAVLSELRSLGRIEVASKTNRGLGHGSGAPTITYRVRVEKAAHR